MNKEALVIKLIAGIYTIIDLVSGEIKEAKPLGKLRFMKLNENSLFNKNKTFKYKNDIKLDKISPKVGDIVDYELKDNYAFITNIHQRKNELDRPCIANVDRAILVFSTINPNFSFYLLDTFLILLNKVNIKITLLITKIDLILKTDLDLLKKQLSYYKNNLNIDIIYTNNLEHNNMNKYKYLFDNQVVVLAGQTGVGKSSFLNSINFNFKQKTNEISIALGRGKHTTRHVELFSYQGGFIADTPGFSKIDFNISYYDELKDLYLDFIKQSDKCKFGNRCSHTTEPDCQIKKLYDLGKIPKHRYENYLEFIKKIKEQKRIY